MMLFVAEKNAKCKIVLEESLSVAEESDAKTIHFDEVFFFFQTLKLLDLGCKQDRNPRLRLCVCVRVLMYLSDN